LAGFATRPVLESGSESEGICWDDLCSLAAMIDPENGITMGD